jgi:hypothetical protein
MRDRFVPHGFRNLLPLADWLRSFPNVDYVLATSSTEAAI